MVFTPLFVHAETILCPTLSLGSTGTAVSLLQSFLYKTYSDFPAPTGIYDNTTQAAVRQWQKEHNIVTSGTASSTGFGVADAKTTIAMGLCKETVATTTITASVTIIPDNTSQEVLISIRTLFRGMSGHDVSELQQFLIGQGLLAPSAATGFFGTLTEHAVQLFQQREGIVSSGTPKTTGYGSVGFRTRAAIDSIRSSTTTRSTSSHN